MLVLFETAAGFAVFKLLNEKKLQESENLYMDFETPEKASKM
jgi:nucleolar protein 58